jgi:fumarate hydratase class II
VGYPPLETISIDPEGLIMSSDTSRTERDSMGEMQVPAQAYYGASTQRAVLNFPVSRLRIPSRMVRALGLIKQAAARMNGELGLLDAKLADAIAQAAGEVAEGKLDDEFVVDLFQTGSGTSSNMNANEVIANRAAEILGAERGRRDVVHPNDHVNHGQSSNDVIPTAVHLAALLAISEDLEPGVALLRDDLTRKADEFWDVIKTGRTHLQDATPIRMGQVFRGYAGQMDRAIGRSERARDELTEVALGGTAVGTGINTHPEFAAGVCAKLSEVLGFPVKESENHFQAQATLDGVVAASGQLRAIAISVHKIANDIRLLSSGPRTGLGELVIPEVQPGSSIMPGKVNPVIAESAIMVAAQVIGNDQTIAQSGQWGFFELNTMLPVAGHNLVQSAELLGAVTKNFAEKCVRGTTSTGVGPEMVARGLAIVTGLVPQIGYDKAAAIAHEAAKTGKSIREVAIEQTELSAEELDAALDPFKMTQPK